MELFELGCACLETPHLKTAMDAAGLLGRGLTVPVIAAVLWLYGHYAKNAGLKRLGVALLAALLVTAVAVNLLKLAVQSPRPTLRTSYGFPSGDSGTAFSFAAVIALAYPSLAPLVYLLATLAAISRLYFRAHYLWDVLGGAAIGMICGGWVGGRILERRTHRAAGWWARAAYGGIGMLVLATGTFALRLERNIAAHRIADPVSASITAPAVQIDFGTDSARRFLLRGWSPAETWRQPSRSINWVVGREASLRVALRPGRDYRVRFRVYPYRPGGFICQWVEIWLNDRFVRRVYLEQDWNTYEILLPQKLLYDDGNRITILSARAQTADWHGVNPAQRPLSVAFDTMEFFAEPPG